MPRKSTIKTEKSRRIKKDEEPTLFEKSSNGISDYLRFGESYTSLVLGIIAVVLVTVLLLVFVRNRNLRPIDTSNLQSRSTQTQGYQSNFKLPASTSTPIPVITATPTPTKIPVSVAPTKKPTSTPTKSQPAPTKVVAISNQPTKGGGRSYVVKSGDNLWKIAEQEYKSGYNWVDIARANNLSNPNSIENGQKLFLPKAEQKNSTSVAKYVPGSTSGATGTQGQKITGNTYTILKGDNLWDIAVRAYGDGYQWVKISNANKLSNPNLIHKGNKLTIPR